MADPDNLIPEFVRRQFLKQALHPKAFADSYAAFLTSIEKPCVWIRQHVSDDTRPLLHDTRQTLVMSVADDYGV